jgi:hypothetical protein
MDKPVTNNQEESERQKPKKLITLTTWAWIAGVALLLGGAAQLPINPIAGIFGILAGALLLPPFLSFVEKTLKRSITKNQKIAAVILCLMVMGVAVSAKTPPEPTASTVTAPQATTQQATVPPAQAATTDTSSPVPAKQDATNATAVNQTPVPVATPAPQQAPAAQPTVLIQLKGSGTKSTQTFTAPSNWTLSYTYDCSNFDGDRGNFQVYVQSADGGFNDLSPVNELGANGSDTEYYHSGGQFYLEVNSECDWTVTAKG